MSHTNVVISTQSSGFGFATGFTQKLLTEYTAAHNVCLLISQHRIVGSIRCFIPLY